MPIPLPQGVQVEVQGERVRVRGPRGELERSFRPEIGISLEEGSVVVRRSSDEPRMRALHGLTRALINNMILGTTRGFERVLEVQGVGYRAELSGKDLTLHVGFSHPVHFPAPDGIRFEVEPRSGLIKIQGIDKELVGQVASDIRKVRPPEPYKGKGIRYQGEYVRRKAGKAGKVV
jgi:large subunit ribosomal protein L6